MRIQNKKMLEEINQAEYLQKICKETPKITIGTQCGVGIYQFKNIGYRNDELILEFSLIMDKKHSDFILTKSGPRKLPFSCLPQTGPL